MKDDNVHLRKVLPKLWKEFGEKDGELLKMEKMSVRGSLESEKEAVKMSDERFAIPTDDQRSISDRII